MINENKHATPGLWMLSAFLIMSIAANALAADKPKGLSRLATESLPAVGGVWAAQGPAPITGAGGEGITGTSEVGAINAIVAHPASADIVWIGSVNGGIWKTTNATNSNPTWTPQTDTVTSLSISSIERDPTDATHNTLIASTGKYSSYGVHGPVGSLLHTVNGGTVWSEWNPTDLVGLSISGIAPRGGTIVVTSVNGSCVPIYRSTNSGASFSIVSGLPSGRAWDLAGDPVTNSVLFAAINACSGTLSGIYKSTNTGATWTRVSNSTMNALMTDSTHALISVGASGQVFAGIVVDGQLAGIFRSGNGGTSWTQLDTPETVESGIVSGIHPGQQGYIHFSLAADPTNANLVYVGGDRQPAELGSSIGANSNSGRLFRINAAAAPGSQATPLTHCQTTLAGCNGSVSTTTNSAPHADSRAITFDLNGNLLETDDGGIYRRTNPSGTGNWFSVNGNLQITEMHNVVYDRISNMIMGGNQDNGTTEQTGVGGLVWTLAQGGDGGDVSADDATSSTQSIRYSSQQDLDGFHRRTVNASGVSIAWRNPSLSVTGGGPALEGQFTTPVELNRVDPRRILFAAQNDLYESLDRGDTITALGLDKSVQAVAYGGRASGVDKLDLIYAISFEGTNPGGPNVYVRTSGSGAPVQTSASPGTIFLRDIAVDVTDWTKAYVVNQSGQVFSTSNTGASWTNITGNLASGATDLRTIVHIPGNPSVIAVGGVKGVFRMATNNPGVWNQLGTGLSNAMVFDLDYDDLDDTLVAGTLGRGAWKLSAVAVSGTPPSLSINDVVVTEGNSGTANVAFTVSLTPSNTSSAGVDYATANNTATGQSTTVTNGALITIPSLGSATPYPSPIHVSGISEPIRKVTVTLNDLNHAFPADVDILLVGPAGQTVVLMSDTGGGEQIIDVSVTFDDAAETEVSSSGLVPGTYRPTNVSAGDPFNSPAPAGPHGTALSVFNGTSANGTWNLYVLDDGTPDQGFIWGGWSLTFTTGDYSSASGFLFFPPGVTSRAVNITVHGDLNAEANETFFLNLSNPSNATISDSQGQATITNDDVAAPTNVVAAATTATNVNITWTAAAGASTYRVYRSSGGAYTLVSETSGLILSDPTVSANTAYLYKVRSFAGTESVDSNIDVATTVIFTDPTVTTGMPIMKLAYFTELLTAVNAVRSLAGLSGVAFSAPTPAIGLNVRAAYVTDLRNGLDPARAALALPAQTYADPTIIGGSTFIKASCITELRTGVR